MTTQAAPIAPAADKAWRDFQRAVIVRQAELIAAQDVMLDQIAQAAASVLYDLEATEADKDFVILRAYQIAKRGES